MTSNSQMVRECCEDICRIVSASWADELLSCMYQDPHVLNPHKQHRWHAEADP